MTRRCLLPPNGNAAQAVSHLGHELPGIETERLLLRGPILGDFPVWERFFTGENPDFEGGSEGAWNEFCNYTAGWFLHGHGLLAAERKESSVTLGFVLLGLEWEDIEPELGWMFTPEARGQGYATEAAYAARQFGFSLLGEGNFVSYINTQNKPSIAVAERLGAIPEGPALGERETLVYRHGMRRT